MRSLVRTELLPGEIPLRVPGGPCSVVVLLWGSTEPEGVRRKVQADCSVNLVLPLAWARLQARSSRPEGAETEAVLREAAWGPILVDMRAGGPWASKAMLGSLKGQGVGPGDVGLVVGTHGHSDHVGNLGLFPGSLLLVSQDLCLSGDLYLLHTLSEERPLRLGPGLEVWATLGHGGQWEVSVVVEGTALGTVVVAGDMFERQEDVESWQALSEDPVAQEQSRRRVLGAADLVVPCHGAPFRVLRGTQRPCGPGAPRHGRGSWALRSPGTLLLLQELRPRRRMGQAASG